MRCKINTKLKIMPISEASSTVLLGCFSSKELKCKHLRQRGDESLQICHSHAHEAFKVPEEVSTLTGMLLLLEQVMLSRRLDRDDAAREGWRPGETHPADHRPLTAA